MLTHTKKIFQLSLITLFAGMMVLGVAATASADHTSLDLKIVIKEECHNGTDKPIKRIIKSFGNMTLDPTNTNLQSLNACGNSCDTPYPSWDSFFINIDDFDGVANNQSFWNIGPFGAAGVSLTKNLKKGTFQTVVDSDSSSTVGNRVLSLSGKVVSDKKAGDLLKIVGKINGYDSTAECTYVGKFKNTIIP